MDYPDMPDILAHIHIPQVSTLFGSRGASFNDHRIVLEKLPNELLDMIMGYLDAVEIHPFLFSRQLNPAATRAVYLNLDIVVWKRTPEPAGFAQDEYTRAVASVWKKMQKIDLLVDTADEAEYLFEYTRTLSMRLSDMNSSVLTRLCLGIRPSLNHNPWDSWDRDPLIYHNIDPRVWDRSLAALLLRTPSIKGLDFDWIYRMTWTADILQNLTDLRTLKIRGTSDMSNSNEPSLFGEGSNPFIAIMSGNMLLPEKLESFVLNDITIVGRGQVAVARGKQELKAEFVDCVAKLQNGTQQWFGGWSGLTKARMIFDGREIRLFNLRTLDNSRLTIKSLEIVTRSSPIPTSSATTTLWIWSIYTSLSQLPRLTHLRISYWITPMDTNGPSPIDPDPLSDKPLKTLTNLDLVVDESQAHPRDFKDKFRLKLAEILGAECLPALKRIKIMPQPWMVPTPDTDLSWNFQALFIYAHATWNDPGQS